MEDNMKTEIDQELSNEVDRIFRAICEKEFEILETPDVKDNEHFGGWIVSSSDVPKMTDWSNIISYDALAEEFSMASLAIVDDCESITRTRTSSFLGLLQDHFKKTHPNEPCIIDDYDHHLLDDLVIDSCLIQNSCSLLKISLMYVEIHTQVDGSYKAVIDYCDAAILHIPYEDTEWEDLTPKDLESVGSSVITALKGLPSAKRWVELKAMT